MRKMIIMFLTLLLLMPSVLWAHKITVFAWVEGKKVYVESKFSGGRKVAKGKVSVVNKDGKILNVGVTGKKGEYSFSVKKPEPMKVYVDAGSGHKGYWELNLNDFGISRDEPDKHVDETKSIKKEVQADHSDIKEIVDSVVKERLKPLQREIALLRQSKEPGFRDIVGGIGYIFGLMGIFLYFKYGREKK